MSLTRSIGHSIGCKLSNMAYSHSSLKFLSFFSYKNSRFLEFKIKRNSLKNTCPTYIVFVHFYFGKKSLVLSLLKATQANLPDRDCRPSKQGFIKWKEKICWRIVLGCSVFIHVFFFGGPKLFNCLQLLQAVWKRGAREVPGASTVTSRPRGGQGGYLTRVWV